MNPNDDNMSSRIFIGRLPFNTDQNSLRRKFEKHGKVLNVSIHRGYGFIQYDNDNSAASAINSEHQTDFMGMKINVKQAVRNNPSQQQQRGGPRQQQEAQPPPHMKQFQQKMSQVPLPKQQNVQQNYQENYQEDYQEDYQEEYEEEQEQVPQTHSYPTKEPAAQPGQNVPPAQALQDVDMEQGDFDDFEEVQQVFEVEKSKPHPFPDNREKRPRPPNNQERRGGHADEPMRGMRDQGRGRRGPSSERMRDRFSGERDRYRERDRERDRDRHRYGRHDGPPSRYHRDYHSSYPSPASSAPPPPPRPLAPQETANDCEIVCVSRGQRVYAEMIESRLKNLGMTVDVLFPNPEIPLVKILSNITSRGVLYAILVTPMHEENKSVTVNMLQGQQQEHRNMPIDDAINLIAKTFEKSLESKEGSDAFALPKDISTIMDFLRDKRPVSVMEYDKLIKYLAMRRERMLRSEYGENIPAHLVTPPIGPSADPVTKAKEEEIKTKIMGILNKPRETAPPSVNPSLQQAIDSLFKAGANPLGQAPSSSSSVVPSFSSSANPSAPMAPSTSSFDSLLMGVMGAPSGSSGGTTQRQEMFSGF